MAIQHTRLSGDQWQAMACQILTRHYGPTEFVLIADNQHGDAGIEGYSRCGHAYQCYGCEEPISTADRYQKQRDKLTADIRKFIDNRAKLEPLFGTTKITRWVLFVPFSDSKDITAHANKKRDEVIAANLPYVGHDFQIHVCQEDHFSAERDAVLSESSEALHLTASRATAGEIANWTGVAENIPLLQTLESKLGRLKTLTTDERRVKFRETVLQWHLEGQELLATLRNYPLVHEKVVTAKAHRENGLGIACLTHEGTEASLLNETLKSFISEMQQEARELDRKTAEALAREAVGDWLLRCPLDFPG